ncbi:hypothetical protein HZS_2977 [Henneguya salminicola]|nr:hypothetical protein HZS_2977 [Henneguya salminicola]
MLEIIFELMVTFKAINLKSRVKRVVAGSTVEDLNQTKFISGFSQHSQWAINHLRCICVFLSLASPISTVILSSQSQFFFKIKTKRHYFPEIF